MGLLFYLKLFALTIPIFFIIDIIWLGIIAKGFYRRHLGFILSPDVDIVDGFNRFHRLAS